MLKGKHRSAIPALLAGIGAGLTMAAGLGLLAYAVKWEPNWIEVCHIDVTLPDLPQSWDGYRIVQISDIHAGKWMPAGRLNKIVETVNGQDPDLIAITGDFVTRIYWGVLD
ncbi:MAG: metallophosphoesterase, partial [Chloroflexota bacterium]|nr:metallophosphoesterase [Chloroflexota bacterium]